MADTDRVATALHSELERAKNNLKDVDENIRKLTGRDPLEYRNVVSSAGRGSPIQEGRGRERIFSLARRSIVVGDGVSPAKRGRMMGGAFSRLGPRVGGRGRRRDDDSGDEEDLPRKPTVPSSVIATPVESRSRKDSIEESNKDVKGKARNKRMFGLLLGTLRQFKDDSKVHRDKDDQRRQIEEKLEEKAKQEKEELQQQKRELFQERRQKQAKVRLIEQKMELVRMHEEWEKETCKLANFIRTKTRPHLFYLPKAMTPELDKKLRSTQKVVSEMIHKRREKLEKEIDEIMNEGNRDDKKEGESDSGEGEGEAEHSEGSGSEDNRDSHRSKHRVHDNKENKDKKERERDHRRSKSDKRESRKSHETERRVSTGEEDAKEGEPPLKSVIEEKGGNITSEVEPSEQPDPQGRPVESDSDTRQVSGEQNSDVREVTEMESDVHVDTRLVSSTHNHDQGNGSDTSSDTPNMKKKSEESSRTVIETES
ncbi:hypothetical protein ScPMuIL_013840 [Solemya velum]